jgi:hypothetical protein
MQNGTRTTPSQFFEEAAVKCMMIGVGMVMTAAKEKIAPE